MGLVPGVNTRPLIWMALSARSADARKARFLVEYVSKMDDTIESNISVPKFRNTVQLNFGKNKLGAKRYDVEAQLYRY